MWIVISGPPGTSKHKIANILASDGFEYKALCAIDNRQSAFSIENQYFTERVKLQSEIELIRNDRHIITVGSAWEGPEIYARVAFKRAQMNSEEMKLLQSTYERSFDALKPPDAFIYMRCENKMSSFNKMLLEGSLVSEEVFMALVEGYELFKSKLAIPTVDIDHNDNFDAIIQEVQYSIQSLRSSGISNFTIWKKGIFK